VGQTHAGCGVRRMAHVWALAVARSAAPHGRRGGAAVAGAQCGMSLEYSPRRSVGAAGLDHFYTAETSRPEGVSIAQKSNDKSSASGGARQGAPSGAIERHIGQSRALVELAVTDADGMCRSVDDVDREKRNKTQTCNNRSKRLFDPYPSEVAIAIIICKGRVACKGRVPR
jgi:hypothetical protein